jgi:hypothetical protein
MPFRRAPAGPLELVMEFLWSGAISGHPLISQYTRAEMTLTVADIQSGTPVWHGTSLLAAWRIFHHGFSVGQGGHVKNGSHRNGIWGMRDPQDAMRRANTSSGEGLGEVSQCPRGFFDCWSTPVAIEFMSVDPPTQFYGGLKYCMETLNGQSLYHAGSVHQVRHIIRSIRIQPDQYNLYRLKLGCDSIRQQIVNGDLVMCTARWCYPGLQPEELADALVNPVQNPCGKVATLEQAWSEGWHKSKSSRRWFCSSCKMLAWGFA